MGRSVVHSWPCGILPKSGIPSSFPFVGPSVDIWVVWGIQGPHPASCACGSVHCRGQFPSSLQFSNAKTYIFFFISTFCGLRVISSYEHDFCILMVQKINLDHYITHKLPFSKIQEAFDLLNTGGCIRCVMDYDS